MYVCVHKDQKKALDLLKLELQMIVCHHVGDGNRAQVYTHLHM